MEAVIVTGANGFIGSSLVKKLIEAKIQVVAIDVNFQEDRLPKSNLITKIESVINESILDNLPDVKFDAFYNLAWRGVNGIDKADPTIQLSNIQIAIDCAKFSKKLGVKKYLCAGTVAENATFSLPKLKKTAGGMMYGVAKHACRMILENYCKNIEQPFVWMQFSNIYGIGNRTGNLVSYTVAELLSGKEPTFGPAMQPYDFIYVDDLIEAIYRLSVCQTSENFYYIGSGKPRLLKDFLYRIGEIAGVPDKIHIGIRPDDGVAYSLDMFDNSKLVEAIGEYVNMDFDEGIKRTIEWLNVQSR